jgi:hypothetical protein
VGTVGTARGKSGSWVLHSALGYCRVLWVLWVLQVCTAGYCRVLQGVHNVRLMSAASNTKNRNR